MLSIKLESHGFSSLSIWTNTFAERKPKQIRQDTADSGSSRAFVFLTDFLGDCGTHIYNTHTRYFEIFVWVHVWRCACVCMHVYGRQRTTAEFFPSTFMWDFCGKCLYPLSCLDSMTWKFSGSFLWFHHVGAEAKHCCRFKVSLAYKGPGQLELCSKALS